jgi:lipopolysaccharide transport system permease protein
MNRTKTVIDPEHRSATYWKDLWAYRGLFRFLAWRDLLVQYKQTVIGVAWSVIRPLLTIVVFTFIGRLIHKTASPGEMALAVAAATLPWTLFSTSLGQASNSLIANSNLITKVYFPRLIIPLSTVIVCLVDFLISVVIVTVMFIYYGEIPGSNIIFLPLFILLTLFSSIGAGVFLASLNVKYRDFRYIVPFVIQLGLYASPVAFDSKLIMNGHYHMALKTLYCVNPMVGIIDGFRWCLFNTEIPYEGMSVKMSCFITICLLIIGIRYFRKVEKNFADII